MASVEPGSSRRALLARASIQAFALVAFSLVAIIGLSHGQMIAWLAVAFALAHLAVMVALLRSTRSSSPSGDRAGSS
jgi:hypothetical protein